MTIADLAFAHQQKFQRYADQFRKMFGVSLSDYWDNLHGFDCVKFDDKFVRSGELSVAQAVQNKWGEAAVALCRELLAPITLTQP